jgi:hypothetical protein
MFFPTPTSVSRIAFPANLFGAPKTATDVRVDLLDVEAPRSASTSPEPILPAE